MRPELKHPGINGCKNPVPPFTGACFICNRDPGRLYLDHCHDTMVHRGWLCASCNSREGKMRAGISFYHDVFSYVARYGAGFDSGLDGALYIPCKEDCALRPEPLTKKPRPYNFDIAPNRPVVIVPQELTGLDELNLCLRKLAYMRDLVADDEWKHWRVTAYGLRYDPTDSFLRAKTREDMYMARYPDTKPIWKSHWNYYDVPTQMYHDGWNYKYDFTRSYRVGTALRAMDLGIFSEPLKLSQVREISFSDFDGEFLWRMCGGACFTWSDGSRISGRDFRMLFNGEERSMSPYEVEGFRGLVSVERK